MRSTVTAEDILRKLQEGFAEAIVESKLDAPQPWIKVAPDSLEDLALFLRDDPETRMDYLMCLSGVDYSDGSLGVVYHLASMEHRHKIVLKASCTREHPHVRTVSFVWGTANWHEREAFDLFGIVFDGHPDLRRLLLPDDWEGYPLRKDYEFPKEYRELPV